MIELLLKKSTIGLFSLLTSQSVKLLAQIINLSVLARLLSPDDYGVTAVALAFIGFGEVFRDFGLPNAAIQEKVLTNSESSNLFWLNSIIGLSLTILFALSSHYVANFFSDERISEIIKVLALVFLINGRSAQYIVVLRREMRFKLVSAIESTALLLSVITSILLAYLNFNYWSIVAQQLILCTATLVGYVAFSGWLPNLPDFNTSIRKFLVFGSNLLGAQIIGKLSDTFPTLIIGQQFGASVLGLFNRAQQVVTMSHSHFNTPASTLALPVLSKLKDDDYEYYRFLTFGNSVYLSFTCLAFSLLVLNVELAVKVILGENWLAMCPLLIILCISVFFKSASYSSYWIFISRGLAKQQLNLIFKTRLVTIVLIIISGFGQVLDVAYAILIASIFTFIVTSLYLIELGLKINSFIKSTLLLVFIYISSLVFSIWSVNSLGINDSNIIKNILFILTLALWFLISKTFRKSILNIPNLILKS